MGLITIEIPQKIKRTYRIASKNQAREILNNLDRLEPKKKLRDLSDVVGIWAYRKESAEEIARELRGKSNMRRRADG